MEKQYQLIVYDGFKEDDIIHHLITLKDPNVTYENFSEHYYKLCEKLIKYGNQYKWKGNLLIQYVAFQLLNHENTFSLMYEKKLKDYNHPILELVDKEVEHIIDLLNIQIEDITLKMNSNLLKTLFNYEAPSYHWNLNRYYKKVYNELEKGNKKETINGLMDFFYNVGVGAYAWYKAFRWDEDKLTPIKEVDRYQLEDLIGIEIQKKKVIDNTEAFLKGCKANNVLLYGDSGTGKSSTIKAILNEYYQDGLRMIEVYKYQFKDLPKIIDVISDRQYKWILFFDDLSFEEFEIEYKYLKATIEGSLEKKRDNLLIYATSNRRNLIKETWKDRVMAEDEVHTNDTMEEKLSLADRFGLSIMFLTPNRKEYLKIVKEKAEKANIDIDEERLKDLALKWEIQHSSFSGRVAEQFINTLK
ncbi:hypothetical protein EDC19_0995 [Natranaerovirga hydrolytica]|uniref:Uncharacterized protein n=1 Tax=Natranaerovirga hydrolytica TaxID=680378 RepID=A0A4R1MZF6_9FIRM|nr:ATP-binding protein [Natranaerovirga hydrolytica]TCK98565.1 hypothetical protein EDC19_0995 [Natranaerovirga hydrolytica]